MRKALLALIAAAAIVLPAESASAHVPSSACSHWYVTVAGNYTGGMNGTCGTAAAGTQYALIITCTNGETKSTGLRAQGTTGFGVGCDPGHVVDTHSMILR